jgi:hypothetical protein
MKFKNSNNYLSAGELVQRVLKNCFQLILCLGLMLLLISIPSDFAMAQGQSCASILNGSEQTFVLNSLTNMGLQRLKALKSETNTNTFSTTDRILNDFLVVIRKSENSDLSIVFKNSPNLKPFFEELMAEVALLPENQFSNSSAFEILKVANEILEKRRGSEKCD